MCQPATVNFICKAVFFFRFPMMEKSPKDQADGKCNHTSPYPQTVGMAHTRSIIASC